MMMTMMIIMMMWFANIPEDESSGRWRPSFLHLELHVGRGRTMLVDGHHLWRLEKQETGVIIIKAIHLISSDVT